MNHGNLYIVATPIGNIQDISIRATELLKSIEYVACEDTRRTGLLLKSIGFEQKPMLISYYDGKEKDRIPNILNLLLNGKDVALVSDSGTPLISDPGFPLVRECLKNEIKVISIPGPSAVISSLVISGQPTDKFIFLGFLPRKEGNRRKLLENLKESNKELEATVVIYEAPHRLVKSLLAIKEVFGSINITICRELTKIYEESTTSNIDSFLSKYDKTQPKGEFVILFNPKTF